MNDKQWAAVERVARSLAESYDNPTAQDIEDATQSGILNVLKALAEGKVGQDVVYALRQGVATAMVGDRWMDKHEYLLEAPENLFDGLIDAFDIVGGAENDAGVSTYSWAVDLMMDMELGVERQVDIQEALHEVEAPKVYEPSLGTVFSALPEVMDLTPHYSTGNGLMNPLESAEEVYACSVGHWDIHREQMNEEARSTKALNEHYDLEDVMDANEDLVDTAIEVRIKTKRLYDLAEGVNVQENLDYLIWHTRRLTDLEKSMVGGRVYSAWRELNPDDNGEVGYFLAGMLGIDTQSALHWGVNSLAEGFLFGASPDPDTFVDLGLGEDDNAVVADFLSPPPQHPLWKPWHDRAFTEHSDALVARISNKEAIGRGFAGVRAQMPKGYLGGRGSVNKRGTFKVAGLFRDTETGLLSFKAGNGRKVSLKDLVETAGLYTASCVEIVGGPERQERLVDTLYRFNDPHATYVAERLEVQYGN